MLPIDSQSAKSRLSTNSHAQWSEKRSWMESNTHLLLEAPEKCRLLTIGLEEYPWNLVRQVSLPKFHILSSVELWEILQMWKSCALEGVGSTESSASNLDVPKFTVCLGDNSDKQVVFFSQPLSSGVSVVITYASCWAGAKARQIRPSLAITTEGDWGTSLGRLRDDNAGREFRCSSDLETNGLWLGTVVQPDAGENAVSLLPEAWLENSVRGAINRLVKEVQK